MKSLSDTEILATCAADSTLLQPAFAELFRRHSSRIYGFCMRFLNDRDLCEDVAQDVFIRFYLAVREHREVRNARAYLLTIARNQCVSTLRERRADIMDVLIAEPVSLDSAVDVMDEGEELAQLAVLALEVLPAEQKDSLLLQVYGGLSYKEISEELGVPLTTVRNWIVRGKKRLREVLEKQLVEIRR